MKDLRFVQVLDAQVSEVPRDVLQAGVADAVHDGLNRLPFEEGVHPAAIPVMIWVKAAKKRDAFCKENVTHQVDQSITTRPRPNLTLAILFDC